MLGVGDREHGGWFEDLARGDVLAHLLAKDSSQPQDEPLIAANIHEQLQHMGSPTWSISVLRRCEMPLADWRLSEF